MLVSLVLPLDFDDQLAEVLAFEQIREGFRRIGQVLHDVLAKADTTLGYPLAYFVAEDRSLTGELTVNEAARRVSTPAKCAR